MKIIHISTSDRGGAGISAVRLHNALLNSGIDSSLLTKMNFVKNIRNHFVLNPETLWSRILVRAGIKKNKFRALEKEHLANRPHGFEKFSFPFSEIDLTEHPAVNDADLIHLHWVSDRFFDFESFFQKVKKPIVWRLADMNPFTGGCHHADDSIGFEKDCHACPQLKGTMDENFAEKVLTVKKNALKNISIEQFKIVTPSHWLMNLSKRSALFSKYHHRVIPNIVDMVGSSLLDKKNSRQELNFPADKNIILFIATDMSHLRKGIVYLNQAVNLLDKNIVVCGVGKTNSKLSFPNFINLGYVNDKYILSKIYNAADIHVLPSLAENFPNTICESLVAGTPVVAFNIGGIPELIDNSNGRLAEYKNVESLANAISYVLNNPHDFSRDKIRNDALQKFGPVKVVKQYQELYQSFE